MTYHCLNCGKEMEFRAMYCSAACRDAFRAQSVTPVAVTDVTPEETVTPATVTHSRRCKNCDAPIDFFARRNKEFCGANCRKQWSRRRDKYRAQIGNARHALGHLRQMLKEWDDLRPEINEQLKWLRDEVNGLLALTDKDTIQETFEKSQMLTGYRNRRNS